MGVRRVTAVSLPSKASNREGKAWIFLFAAWTVALVSTLGALFIGEVLGQVPCTLCWHQRIFMFPLAVLLAIACYRSDAAVWPYVSALAAIGWFLAAWHSLLYFGVVSEAIQPCGAGPSCSGSNMMLLDAVPIPLLSLLAFTAILVLMLALIREERS